MDPIDPEEAARRKKSIVLLAGGAASLALPLLGILYMRWNESRGITKQTGTAEVFEQREGERRVTPAAAPAMAAAVALGAPAQAPSAPPRGVMAPLPSGGGQAGGSLGFIKPSDDYFKDKPAEAPAPKKEAAAPTPREAPRAAPAKTAKTSKAKPGKKAFAMPKLNTTKGFTSFKRNQPGAAADEVGGDDAPIDMAEMLKSIPGGANNPDVQKYLNQR